MKRFTFRLERLERVRRAGRRQAHAALALALGEAFLRQHERESREADLREAVAADLPPHLSGEGWAVRGLAAWREGLRGAALGAARREIEALDTAIDAERAHTEAARAHRVLERLHERRKQEWNERLSREEQKVLDELHLLLRARENEETEP